MKSRRPCPPAPERTARERAIEVIRLEIERLNRSAEWREPIFLEPEPPGIPVHDIGGGMLDGVIRPGRN